MKTETSSLWKKAINSGLISGIISILVPLVGMVESFEETSVVRGVFTLADIILFAPLIMLTFSVLRSAANYSKKVMFGISAVIGLLTGTLLSLLILLGQVIDMRVMFVNASPVLFNYLMRSVPQPLGILI